MSESDISKPTSPEDPKSVLPEEMTEVLESLPSDKRKVIEALMISQTSMISRVSPEMEVSKKVTGDHISKMLETDAKAMEHTFKDKTQARVFGAFIISMAVAALLALVILLKDNPEYMEKIITIALSTLVGGAGGYGLGFKKGKDDN